MGATLGGYFAAPLLPIYGWESLFITGGLITFCMLVPIYFFMPESIQFLMTNKQPNSLNKVNKLLLKFDKEPLIALPDSPVETNKDTPLKSTVGQLLNDHYRSRTLGLWLTFFFCFVCLYFLISWIPKLVINSGLSESEGVYASAALNGGGVIGVLLLGWLASKFTLSHLIGTFLSLAAIAMIVLAVFISSLPLLMALAVIGFLIQGGFVGLYSAAAKIYPTHIRSTGVGWAIGLGRLGAVVGPYVGGVLIAKGFSLEANFSIFAIPLIISGFLAYRLNTK
jgi:predicted MFS family arabinose efflux permease